MYIASASTTVKLHDFPNGNVFDNYHPGSKVEGSIRSMSWSKDGNWLVLVPHSGFTEIVGVKDKLQLLRTIQNVDEPTCATFQNTTKKFIGMGTKNGLVLIFDVKTRHTKKRFERATSQITHVDFTAKDSHCVAACKNGDVLVHNITTNSPPSVMRVPKSSSVSCVKTHKTKQNLILGGSNEGIVCVWDNNINRSKFYFKAHEAPVSAVAFSPINKDLIVSTGSDRQCRFFDIFHHKPVANFDLKNSATAIDFSPDGNYLVIASQNGQISVFDPRYFLEPLHSFQAHDTAIKHLLFQNPCSSANTSSCDLSIEATPIASDENLDNRSKRTSDMFRAFIPSSETTDGVTEVANKRKSLASVEGGDSFLAALGVDNTSTTDSVKNEDSVFHKYLPPKLSTIIGETSESGDQSNQVTCQVSEMPEIKPKQYTSTPVFFRSETCQLDNNVPSSDVKAIEEIIKEQKSDISSDLQVIKQEMKEVTNDLKNEIKCEATVIRRMLLETQMAMVKEALKMEDWCNNLKERMNWENGHDVNMLLEENDNLRRRIEFLEEQLKNATSKSDSSGTM